MKEKLYDGMLKKLSETTQYLIKRPPNKYFGGQSQDSSVIPESSCIIVLTLIGPNSLMAARYLQWLQCTVDIPELALN